MLEEDIEDKVVKYTDDLKDELDMRYESYRNGNSTNGATNMKITMS